MSCGSNCQKSVWLMLFLYYCVWMSNSFKNEMVMFDCLLIYFYPFIRIGWQFTNYGTQSTVEQFWIFIFERERFWSFCHLKRYTIIIVVVLLSPTERGSYGYWGTQTHFDNYLIMYIHRFPCQLIVEWLDTFLVIFEDIHRIFTIEMETKLK